MRKDWIRVEDHERVVGTMQGEINRLQKALDKALDRFLAFSSEASINFASLQAAEKEGPGPTGSHLESPEDQADQEEQAELAKEAEDFNAGHDEAEQGSLKNLVHAENRLRGIRGDGRGGI